MAAVSRAVFAVGTEADKAPRPITKAIRMPILRPRRSLIFAPGNKPEMFPKALGTGADVVCVDLEDAVAPQHKDQAREATIALFAEWADKDTGAAEPMVRINALRSPDGIKDLAAVLASPKPPKALMLPKLRTADEIKLLDEVLSEAQSPIRLHCIIETNDALENAFQIARASDRIDSLLFGAVDLAADLRTTNNWDQLVYARSRAVHAAAGAGVDLIDVPWLDLEDMDGMIAEAEKACALGFTGKGAIHPKQIGVLNDIFSPSAAQIEQARKIVDAFAESDSGLVVIDGKLIEKPVLRSMERLLAIADRIGA
jgi:(S)-citramalyl-CoA lyase